jgi:hypothetical protein
MTDRLAAVIAITWFIAGLLIGIFIARPVAAADPWLYQIKLGEWSAKPAQVFVCDSLEAMEDILDVHVENGIQAAQSRIHHWGQVAGAGGPHCGVTAAYVLPVQAARTGVYDGLGFTLAEVVLLDARTLQPHTQSVWSVLWGVQVVEVKGDPA